MIIILIGAELVDFVNNVESDEEIEEEDDDDSWNEMEAADEDPVMCLFCDEITTSIEKAVEHLNEGHHINLSAVKMKFNLDQISYIKVRFSAYCFHL